MGIVMVMVRVMVMVMVRVRVRFGVMMRIGLLLDYGQG